MLETKIEPCHRHGSSAFWLSAQQEETPSLTPAASLRVEPVLFLKQAGTRHSQVITHVEDPRLAVHDTFMKTPRFLSILDVEATLVAPIAQAEAAAMLRGLPPMSSANNVTNDATGADGKPRHLTERPSARGIAVKQTGSICVLDSFSMFTEISHAEFLRRL